MKKYNLINAILSLIFLLNTNLYSQDKVEESLYNVSRYLLSQNLDSHSQWSTFSSDSSGITLSGFSGYGDDGIHIEYNLKNHEGSSAWAVMSRGSIQGFTENTPLILLIKADADSDIEFKFIDTDGSVFLKRYSIKNRYHDWTQVVVYLKNMQYGWGGNSSFGTLSKIELAFSSEDTGSGSILIDEIGLGKEGIRSGNYLDPYRDADGTGFYQRRSDEIIQEDPLLIEYLKAMQDFSSPEAELLPNQDGDIYVSTFNNALVAIAYIIKDEKERAEGILNFFADALDEESTDIAAQSFYYNGEARGFYQHVNINTYKRVSNSEDRWIGDMAWLAVAYKQYEKAYGIKSEYTKVTDAISNLLVTNYKNVDEDCGCIQTGWQDGDQLFDNSCHHEGNISSYAAFMACGKYETAAKVKKWLHKNLNFENPPLDIYTWQVLAFKEDADSILKYPEFDFQYRKKLFSGNDSIYGIYSFANIEVLNTWTEGIGHLACALFEGSDEQRANFYTNQFDPLLLQYDLYGKNIKTLSYAFNKTGDYQWINNTIGAVSTVAWYIFAKNSFNPLDTSFPDRIREFKYTSVYKIYPNPATEKIWIEGESFQNKVTIYNSEGKLIFQADVHEKKSVIEFCGLKSGLYFIKIQNPIDVVLKKLIIQ